MNQRLPLISLILNGVLAIAVVVLYVLHFNGAKSSVAVTDGTDSIQEAILEFDSLPDLGSDNGAIAFIDFDELRKRSKFYEDGKASFERDYKKKEAEYMKQQQAYEESVGRYQQLAPSLTPDVRAKREGELMGEQQKLLALRDRMENDLADKNESFTKDFLNKLDGYLKVLSKEKNYSYVFTYTKGSPATIVYAKDTLNISDQVIHALNEQYKKK